MKTPFLILLVALLILSGPVSAAESRGYSRSSSASMDSGSPLPVGGSIAMPGTTTATYTNPAGLAANSGARLSLQAGSEHPMEDPSARALLLGGNGMIGASAGVQYEMRDGTSEDTGYAVYGLALNVSALDFSLGVGGKSGIKTAKGTDLNGGILFRPMSLLTIGATAYGIDDTIESYGVGAGLTLLSGIDLVVDAGLNDKFKEAEFKPGLRLSNGYAGLSMSYGTGATAQFAKDVSAAAYLKVSGNSELEIEYNHGGSLPKYFASLTFGF